VGGSYENYQRSLPVLQYIGRTVTYLGKSGNGQIGKIINEMMQAFSQLAMKAFSWQKRRVWISKCMPRGIRWMRAKLAPG
jgi:hypothetical protein